MTLGGTPGATTPRWGATPFANASLAALHRFVVAHTGITYFQERPADFAARVGRRLDATGARNAADYLARVRGDSPESVAERNALIDAVTIGETFFFRFAEQFAALRDRVLPLLLHANRAEQSLRVWSAACASGAELYSIAILLRRHFGDGLADWQVSLTGTDINTRLLEQARRARYGGWALRSLDPEVRHECFERTDVADEYVLKQVYRAGVRFAPHNLVHDPPPLPFPPALIASGMEPVFDVVFCRNVLIYFDAETGERVLARIAECQRPGGWLFLGHAESAAVTGEAARAYEPVAVDGAFVYRRRERLLSPPPSARPRTLPALDPVQMPAPAAERESLFLPQPEPSVAIPVPTPPSPPERVAESPVARMPSDPGPPTLRAQARECLDAGDGEAALRLLLPPLTAGAPSGPRPQPGQNGGAAATPPPRHDAVLHYYAALAYALVEQLDEAERSLRRALYLDRALVLAHYQLALVAEGRGDLAQAERSLRTVLKILENDLSGGQLQEVSEVTTDEMQEIARVRLAAVERTRARA